MSVLARAMLRKITLVLLAFGLGGYSAWGQEQLGTIMDNYNPVTGAMLNPAVIVDQGPWIDFNLVGVASYQRSNFAHIPNSYLLRYNELADPVVRDPGEDLYGYVAQTVMGPSFSMTLKDHAIGFHTAVRGVGFIKDVPGVAADYMEEEPDFVIYDGLYEGNHIRVKEMAWEEYGITYGRIVSKRYNNMYSAAITLNRLSGFHAAGAYMRQGALRVEDQEATLVNINNGKYWYNEPARGAGKGWSTSLGFEYKKMLKDVSSYVPHSRFGKCQVAQYKHQLGVALVDVGAITFKSQALTNEIDEGFPLDSTDNWSDISEEALAAAEATKYTAWLPAAITIQYDYYFQNNIYFNALLVNRLSIRRSFGTERSNLFMIGARYETKPLTVSMPLSFHAYKYAQLGFSLRIWSLVIGTDNIGPFIKTMDIRAADIYASLKIPIFKSPDCRHKNFRSRRNRGNYKRHLCPAF